MIVRSIKNDLMIPHQLRSYLYSAVCQLSSSTEFTSSRRHNVVFIALRKLLLATANRSILIIEDIDSSVDNLPDCRYGEWKSKSDYQNDNNTTSRAPLTLLLNFIDGLCSSCGDESIIIFTTNHKERLDPALLRPGCMYMHILYVLQYLPWFKLLQNRQHNESNFEYSNTKMTLSGLLNFADGLWSSCGDERIIVFTTNHKDCLDPALLCPSRMDVHINLSYYTPNGFKTLASNYLGVHDDQRLCNEIEGLISRMQVTPAEIAEELMKSDNVDVALEGLVNFLKQKTIEMNKTQEKETTEVIVVEDKVVKFLQQKNEESVEKKDIESLDAIVALEDLVDLVARKRIEADHGILRKDEEGSDNQTKIHHLIKG